MVDLKARSEQISASLVRHPALSEVTVQETRGDGGIIMIAVVAVSLPGRAVVDGRSATGVLAKEVCTFVFAPNWPVSGPRVFLRADFPLNLPHINPHREGTLVSPCLFEGSIDEVFHRFGIDAVIDQLVDWLAKAAAGLLIDHTQGWEPTRRDHNDGCLVFDAHALNTAIAREPISAYPVKFMAQESYLLGQVNGYIPVDLGAFHYTANSTVHQGKRWVSGETVVLVAHAPQPNWDEQTFSEYFPDTVSDLTSLLDTASRLGIETDAFGAKIKDFFRDQDMTRLDTAKEAQLFLLVVLAVRRPVHLLNDRSRTVEFLPYFLRYAGNVVQHTIEVFSVWHSYALSADLLRQASGFDFKSPATKIVLAGCGSLGSKIGLHLGRAGFGQFSFVDMDWLSPHNMARHALLVNDFAASTSKAELMRAAFAELSYDSCLAYDGDFTTLLTDEADFTSVGCHEARLIIDATASLKVLTAETMSPLLDAAPGRLVRVLMYGQGQCTAVFVEGESRSCRIDDLTAALFNTCRVDPKLRRAIGGETSDPVRLLVGDNCSSMTTPMPDSVVSRSAALASMRIEHMLRDDIPDAASLSFGIIDDSGIGVTWREISIGPTDVLCCALGSGWTVRVPQWVAESITADAKHWGGLETGGALIGHLNEATQTIVIGGLVEPPVDSKRAAAEFILGTDALVPALAKAHEDSLGHLHFIGTWHTHPMGGGHSSIDRATLAKLSEIAPDIPIVSLIWTPDGLLCAVEQC
jgi:hypothetical protein